MLMKQKYINTNRFAVQRTTKEITQIDMCELSAVFSKHRHESQNTLWKAAIFIKFKLRTVIHLTFGYPDRYEHMDWRDGP